MCGFIGHGGRLGCSKCLKRFTGSFGNINYSGFDRENWPQGTPESHRAAVKRILKCYTKSKQQEIESSTGYRYTVLLELPYFNSTRMLVIDPMHNPFLGSAKHVLKHIWLEKSIIQLEMYKVIQDRIDRCVVPSDMGRIPHKIMSGFSSFTADQLKNWVVYYSLIVLRGFLTQEELECWRHFVLACRLLLHHEITLEQLSLADALLIQFCKRTERMHGSSIITPNMHLHCHLKERVLDYGPLQNFWCFPFERYNGLLGAFPNNNKSIEVQLMNRFCNDRVLMEIQPPSAFSDELSSLIPHSGKEVGTLLDISRNVSNEEHSYFEDLNQPCSKFHVVLPKYYSKQLFTSEEVHQLELLYSKCYIGSTININSAFRKYKTIKVNDTQLGCHKSRSTSSSIVLAKWDHLLYAIPYSVDRFEHRPIKINYFAAHVFEIDGQNRSQILVSVSWYKKHKDKDCFGKPITIWECDLFETSCFDLIPLAYVICRTVSLVDVLDTTGSNALIICPCINF